MLILRCRNTTYRRARLKESFDYPTLERGPSLSLIIPQPAADVIQLFSRQFKIADDLTLLSVHVRLPSLDEATIRIVRLGDTAAPGNVQ
jgi:hypothetical protein